MPRVQSYGGPRVETKPLPQVRHSVAESAAAVAAEGLADIGGQVSTLAFRQGMVMATAERERADESAVLGANNQLSGWINKRLYDPQAGALTIKGKDSQTILDDVPQEFRDQVSAINQSLSSEKQRLAFNKFAMQQSISTDYTLRRHVYGEMQAYDEAEIKGFNENQANFAIANADKPALISQALTNVTNENIAYARRHGFGEEQTTAFVNGARTAIHAGVIDRYLAQDQDQAASVYYDAVKEQIDGTSRARIEKALEDGTLRAQAQRETQRIMDSATSLKEATAMVRDIEDPKLQDEVLQRVEHRFVVNDKIKRDADEATLTRLYNVVETGGLRAATHDPAWADLDGSARVGLTSYARSRAEGTPVKTDQALWYRLFTMASTPATQDDFAKENLLKYKGKLSDGDFQQLAGMQGRAREGDIKGANALAATDSEAMRITNEALMRIGVDPTPETNPKKKGQYDKAALDKVTQFHGVVRGVLAQREHEAGRKLTVQEIQETVDTLIIRTQDEVDNYWWKDDVPAKYAFEPQAVVTRVADVPPKEQKAIRDALAQAGIPATDARILGLFNARLAKMRGEVFPAER